MTGTQPRHVTLTVGQPYSAEVATWPDRHQEWVLTTTLVGFSIFLPYPTLAERREFQHGRVKFALVVGDHAIMLAVKIGQKPWWDAPWQAARQTVAEPGLPDLSDGEAMKVLMVLVNSRSGIVEEMRLTSWPTRFTRAVRQAVTDQLCHRGDDRAGEIEIDAWMARYPTSADLVRRRADQVVNGGHAPT